MGRSKKVTVGYKYYMGIHMAVCQNQAGESVTEIQAGNKTIWAGYAQNDRIFIDKPDIFGGKKREGGIQGWVDVASGFGNSINGYLAAKLNGGLTPAFSGLVQLILNQVYITANNPNIKPWAVRVSNGISNPANIIKSCLTNQDYGLGIPDSMLDVASFDAAAFILSQENFELNLIWSKEDSIENFIKLVCDHCAAVVFQNPSNGLFQIRLLRDFYDPNCVTVLNPSTVISVENFQRVGWGELINEVTVVYTDPAYWKPRAVTVQNIANISTQSGVVAKKVEYPGITNSDLAAKVALRDLRIFSTPLAKIRITADAQAWSILLGDLFKLSWPELNISQIIFRVAAIDYGSSSDNTVTIEAIEDVFSLDDVVISGENGFEFTPADDAAVPPIFSIVYERSYYDLARSLDPANLKILEQDDTLISANAVAANNQQLAWDLYTGPTAATITEQTVVDYTPSFILQDALLKGEGDLIDLIYTAPVADDEIDVGEYGYLVNAGEIAECVQILAIDNTNGLVSLKRGLLDTPPIAHAAGTRFILAGAFDAEDNTARVAGEVVYAGLSSNTSTEVGPVIALQNSPITLQGRQGAPYPPGKFRLNTQYQPILIYGDAAFTWAHRNKIQQTAETFVAQSDGSITPEVGYSYEVEVFNGANLINTYNGITTAGWVYTSPDAELDGAIAAPTFKVYTAVNGYRSLWPQIQPAVIRHGLGFLLGQELGGEI